MDRLAAIRQDPALLAALKVHYRENPWDLINDWGVTVEPRNAEIGLPVVLPFLLFPKQREWLQWAFGLWQSRKSGLTEKARDAGVSWLSVALACTMCITRENINIGFGSRKEEYVDRAGFPKALFWKAREFMEHLPPEFSNGWTRADSVHMRLSFPATRSVITGEAGDSIGRGDRTTLYFVDEAAFLPRPEMADGGLSATTNCRIDISTPNGVGNPFYRKRNTLPSERVFRFTWRDDPRKTEEWYNAKKAEEDPVTFAQEFDLNYAASVEGVLIPSDWVQAAINADQKLGLEISGSRRTALDVADEGKDKNALACARGVKVEQVHEWSGVGSDIYSTVAKAFNLCDQFGSTDMRFDSDGLGAGVRGDAKALNEARGADKITAAPWRGSAKVSKPDKAIPSATPGVKGRTNGDFFKNAKAQGWWELRVRFQRTYRAVTEPDYQYDPDDLIVLAPDLGGLYDELSQPTFSVDTLGKVVVDKAPDGSRSPNKADSVMYLYAPRQGGAYDLAKALDG